MNSHERQFVEQESIFYESVFGVENVIKAIKKLSENRIAFNFVKKIIEREYKYPPNRLNGHYLEFKTLKKLFEIVEESEVKEGMRMHKVEVATSMKCSRLQSVRQLAALGILY